MQTGKPNAYEKASTELGVRMIVYDGAVQRDDGDSQFHARDFLFRDLNAFFEKHSISGFEVPTTGRTKLDVYNLMRIVLENGGFEAVVRRRKMTRVLEEINYKCRTTRYKRFYIEYLYRYEQAFVIGSVPPQAKVQEMIEGTKRL